MFLIKLKRTWKTTKEIERQPEIEKQHKSISLRSTSAWFISRQKSGYNFCFSCGYFLIQRQTSNVNVNVKRQRQRQRQRQTGDKTVNWLT